MRRLSVDLASGGILLAAALLYLLPPDRLLALLLAAGAHELGHLLMILALGLRLRGLRFDGGGLCMEYAGPTNVLGHLLIAASGPLAGTGWAWWASALADRSGQLWLADSAGLSLLLTLYNLLPALPLDGGRRLLHLSAAVLGDAAGRRLTERLSLAVGCAMLAAGIWLLLRGLGAALLLGAVWLLLCQESPRGLVKKRQIV